MADETQMITLGEYRRQARARRNRQLRLRIMSAGFWPLVILYALTGAGWLAAATAAWLVLHLCFVLADRRAGHSR